MYGIKTLTFSYLICTEKLYELRAKLLGHTEKLYEFRAKLLGHTEKLY